MGNGIVPHIQLSSVNFCVRNPILAIGIAIGPWREAINSLAGHPFFFAVVSREMYKVIFMA